MSQTGYQKSEVCLKQGRKISDICLKQGQGMRGHAAPTHPGIYRVPPPPPAIKWDFTVLIDNTIFRKVFVYTYSICTLILFLIFNLSTLAYSSVKQKDQPGLVFISIYVHGFWFSQGLRAKLWLESLTLIPGSRFQSGTLNAKIHIINTHCFNQNKACPCKGACQLMKSVS